MYMDNRVAIVAIIVEDTESIQQVNDFLHQYSQHIIGRMGLPYRTRKICIISIVMDAPQDEVSALAGKLGKLSGVSVKTLFSK